MELFDLFVTWEGFVGVGLSYVVEYRPYPAGGAWTVFATGVTDTYVTIPDLPVGFYEVRIKSDCASEDSEYIYKIEGKEPCPEIEFSSYQIISDNSSQIIRISFTNGTPSVKIKVTRLNDSTIVYQNLLVAPFGYVDVTLNKIAGQTTTYRIEISNICPGIVDNFVDMGEYDVTGPPANIVTSFRMSQDFVSANNCAAPVPDPGSANTGTRVVLSEPLPQAVTIIFDYCRTSTFNPPNTKVCATAPLNGPPRYYSLTLPAGCTTWAAQHFRESSLRPGSYVCIAKVIPEILNNGKRLTFSDAGLCTSYNESYTKINLNVFPNMPQPPCIT